MGYFPLCVDLRGRNVLLIGSGPQIADKIEKLRPFGAALIRRKMFDPGDLNDQIVFVVVGDMGPEDAVRISALCRGRGIPVNVVDAPQLSTFFFPSLITRGDLTVSVSTGGKAPGASALLGQRLSSQIPADTEQILDWLHVLRGHLYEHLPKEEARRNLREATRRALALERCLTDEELAEIAYPQTY